MVQFFNFDLIPSGIKLLINVARIQDNAVRSDRAPKLFQINIIKRHMHITFTSKITQPETKKNVWQRTEKYIQSLSP